MNRMFVGATLTLIMMGASLSTQAGGYLGATVGKTSPDENGFEDDGGFKLTGGLAVNDNVAFEMSYVDMGEFDVGQGMLSQISAQVGQTVTDASIEITGFEVSMLGMLPVTPYLSVYGRIGLLFWDADVNVTVQGFGSGSDGDDGNDPLYGMGVKYAFTDRFGMNVEFTRYDALDSKVDLMGLGIELRL